ncbi:MULTISPECIES: FimV/HubP family polar landmark protein [unclassified Halomonas]|uniref:FimV/HubP family polar landmark protein n=1 Tax=unclassified Halomonas TaxID=2609666 RepID=UPI0009907BEB|nr:MULTISPECIES: FimV/HubP family polar landmark protein [unclassified Halomonas]AQU82617.1 hypothetical protein B2G49_08375 [Halomonas sp. 'Soap Lake \
MKQKLVGLLGVSLSAVSTLALAVGLGPVSVNTPLNAPLSATVPLLDADQYALDDLHITVANETAFTAQGLEWTPLAASLRTELREQSGSYQLVLSSSQVVDELWLDVLLTVSSPEGETSQALTLLFDLPGMRSSTPDVGQPLINAAEPSNHSSAPDSRERSASGGASGANSTLYVASGDSLWGVAERAKPVDASVPQMIVALVDANPEVFPLGDIDSMRAGQTLAMPSHEAIMARSPSDARQAFRAMRQPGVADSTIGSTSLPTAEPEAAPSTTPAATPSTTSSSALSAAPAATFSDPPVSPGTEQVIGGVGITGVAGEDAVSVAVSQATVEVPEGQQQPGLLTYSSQEEQLAGLTLSDLVEQLQESQAMFQPVLEEREQLRTELTELRQEMAALTEALNVSQREVQTAVARASAARDAMVEPVLSASDNPNGISERVAAYQWPIASVVLALLLGALVWGRKRRERKWEAVPLQAVVPPTQYTATPAGGADINEAEKTPFEAAAADAEAWSAAPQLEDVPFTSPSIQPSRSVPADLVPGDSIPADSVPVEEWEVEEVAFEPPRRDNS